MKDYLSYTVEDFITDESYLRYYFKENEADIQFWTEWIGLHPEMLDIIISANNYIDAFSVRLPESEFQKEQQRFAQTLRGLSLDDESLKPRFHRPARRTIAIAAAIVFTVSLTGYLIWQKNRDSSPSGQPSNIAMIEKYAAKGQRANFTLPDGSEVELNADSKLTYPSKFTGPVRELQLSGEGFFRVKNDSLHPFHVVSQNLAITVLGTSFNMQCYPDKQQSKVALVTGKVRLDRISDPVNKKVLGETLILTPSEMGVFNKQSLSLEKTHYDMDEETGWRQGIIVFKDANFNEIALRFDKIFNIRLINKSHKNRFRFTGTFSNTSPEEIVKSICLSKQLSYTINRNIITIH